jgi:kynureninase
MLLPCKVGYILPKSHQSPVMSNQYSLSQAENLDQKDPLKKFRDRFIIRDSSLIYLDGNSLGRLPAETVDYLDAAIRDQWGDRLIRSWNEGWYQPRSCDVVSV